jgi:hypothetical protein
MSNITTIEQLKDELNINDIHDISQEEVQKKFLEILKSNNLEMEVLKEIITIVPDITKTFNDLFKSMENIGMPLEETKRLRWETLREIAKNNNLKDEQILEAMKILHEIEKKETINWESIFKTGMTIVGAVAVAIFGIWSKTQSKA